MSRFESRPEILRQKAAYERGRVAGFDLSQQEARAQSENDLWIFGGTAAVVMGLFTWFLSRRSSIALQNTEKIRNEMTNVLALKEKELHLEQSQVHHLQTMHHEYIARMQRQENIMKRMKKQTEVVSKKMERQKRTIDLMRVKIKDNNSLISERKLKLEEMRGARNVVTLETRHVGHTFAGVGLLTSMWISYQLAYRS